VFNDSAGKGQKRKVVRREAVAVLTQGTLTEPSMVAACPFATYVVAAVEVPVKGGTSDRVTVGVCAVEAAQGRVLVGQFEDGPLRSSLQRCFSGALPAICRPSFPANCRENLVSVGGTRELCVACAVVVLLVGCAALLAGFVCCAVSCAQCTQIDGCDSSSACSTRHSSQERGV
jgi:hypothetical protein